MDEDRSIVPSERWSHCLGFDNVQWYSGAYYNTATAVTRDHRTAAMALNLPVNAACYRLCTKLNRLVVNNCIGGNLSTRHPVLRLELQGQHSHVLCPDDFSRLILLQIAVGPSQNHVHRDLWSRKSIIHSRKHVFYNGWVSFHLRVRRRLVLFQCFLNICELERFAWLTAISCKRFLIIWAPSWSLTTTINCRVMAADHLMVNFNISSFVCSSVHRAMNRREWGWGARNVRWLKGVVKQKKTRRTRNEYTNDVFISL